MGVKIKLQYEQPEKKGRRVSCPKCHTSFIVPDNGKKHKPSPVVSFLGRVAVLIMVVVVVALAIGWMDGDAAPSIPDGFSYTITPGGEFAVRWSGAQFNPYNAESYVVVGDFVAPNVLEIAAMAPLEVKSAACIASGIACDVTWSALVPDLPCHDYDGVIKLGDRSFEFYEQRVGCEGYHQYLAIITGG